MSVSLTALAWAPVFIFRANSASVSESAMSIMSLVGLREVMPLKNIDMSVKKRSRQGGSDARDGREAYLKTHLVKRNLEGEGSSRSMMFAAIPQHS